MQGVVTTTSPIKPSATGIRMKSSDQGVNFDESNDQDVLESFQLERGT